VRASGRLINHRARTPIRSRLAAAIAARSDARGGPFAGFPLSRDFGDFGPGRPEIARVGRAESRRNVILANH